MNAGPTAERVHDALKQEIMNGHFRPGARLDPAVLAADLASSTTPVREALSRLVGAGLVESRTGGGFHMPSLDEPRLKDMYGWSRELLALALRGWPREAEPGAAAPPRPVAAQGQIAEHAAGLFAAIGQRSLNCEHGRAIRRLRSWMIEMAFTMIAIVTAICSAMRRQAVRLRISARQIGPISMFQLLL